MKAKQKEPTEKSTGQSSQLNWCQRNRKQRRDLERKIQSADLTLQLVHPDAAGIDIGNESHYVAVPPDRDSQPVQHFGCTTAELRAMADWLKQCRIRTVAMQSTSVYWIAVYDVLEQAGLEVYLVNAGDEEPSRAEKRCAGESVANEAVILGPGGPRNFMKITQSQARMQKAWSGEVECALEKPRP